MPAPAAVAVTARPTHIAGLRRHVVDVRRSVDFYGNALGFVPLSAGASNERAWLTLGSVALELVRCDAAPAPAVAPDPRFQHAAIVVADMAAAAQHLLAFAPTLISEGGPQCLPANTGGVEAFKFRDPDGHPLELIAFPPGVGDARWQRPADGRLTLGIDHVALVVTDVERSIGFYTGELGFRVVSKGLNRGAAQDRLDGLHDVEVDVIALAPAGGAGTPHLELLGYRRPAFAASTPAPTTPPRADDDVVLLLRDQPGAAERHDPDGHRWLIGNEGRPALWNNAGP